MKRTSDAIALVSADATILHASECTSRLLGYSLDDDFLGCNAFDLILSIRALRIHDWHAP